MSGGISCRTVEARVKGKVYKMVVRPPIMCIQDMVEKTGGRVGGGRVEVEDQDGQD